MEALLTAHLLASTGVLALTGGIRDGELTGLARISWDTLPITDALPCVILHDLGTSGRDYSFNGRTGLIEYLLQLDAWAGTRVDAIALRTALVAALDTLRAPPLQAFIVRDHGATELATGPDAARNTDLHRRSLDVQLWFDPNQT